VLPSARSALTKAQLELDLVMLKLTKEVNHIKDLFQGTGPEQMSWRIFDAHFKIADLPTGEARQSLNFVRQTYAKMRAILDGRRSILGGNPWGANIVEVDPITIDVEKMETAGAYVALEHGNNAKETEATNARLGVSPYRIYFTNIMDGKPSDHYLYVVLHELAHFVDDETKVAIVDKAYGNELRYMTLSHYQRIRNAECYSACAFELAFGNPRLAAMFPLLGVNRLVIDETIIR
jgi:hypothetical protein